MKVFKRSLLIISALVLWVFGVAAMAAETVHKDWTVRCGAVDSTCEMHQVVYTDDARTQRALLAVVGYPKGTVDPGMILMLPLGISLPPGVFVYVDDNPTIKVPVERCERDGCRIELLLADGFLNGLRNGNVLNILAHDRQRRSFVIPLSLQGFTAALNALK